jgi:KUP system potassium uptake protein
VTWQRGRQIVTARRIEEEGPLEDFIAEVRAMDPPVLRVPGTGVFLTANPETLPLALRTNVEHNHALHERVVIVSIETETVPHVEETARVKITDLTPGDDDVTHVTARLGFLDRADVLETLRLAAGQGLEPEVDVEAASYFVSRITIVRTDAPGMRPWRKKLFVAIAHNAADPVAHFGLPQDRTVTMGSRVDL